jgi:hypothetical protein
MGWTTYDALPGLTAAQHIKLEFACKPSATNEWAYGFEYITQRGSTVFGVMWKENPAQGITRQYFGMVFLTSTKGGRFSYKEMGEDCGPYYYAPKKMIDILDQLAPVDPDSLTASWRVRCRAKHQERKAKAAIKWQPGQRVQFSATGPVFEIVSSAGPRRGFHVRMQGGNLYRASAGHMANATIVQGV